jgi:hypothetical protein
MLILFFKRPLTFVIEKTFRIIKSHNLHADDSRGTVGDDIKGMVGDDIRGMKLILFIFGPASYVSFGLSSTLLFCLPYDGSNDPSFIG